MTERLYYDNPYRVEFFATALKCLPLKAGARNSFHAGEALPEGSFLVCLDKSAFYPTSGGQPFDTGALGGRQVLDVYADEEGEVWHVLDGPLEVGKQFAGKIDWPRRFDHMQQHAGEHMLAGQIYQTLRGHTIGLHLGADFSTIDVDLPDGAMRVDAEALREIERKVNENIQRDVPIVCSFPSPEELRRMPLRKPPTVEEHIRVVAIGDFEFVACGGTHPKSTGQIGLLKILDARPNRGKMRVSFVAGMRAYRDYQRRFEVAEKVGETLSTGFMEAPAAVEGLRERLGQAEREAGALKRELLFRRIPDMLLEAEDFARGKLVWAFVEADAPLLRDLASKLIERPGVLALLGARAGEGYLYVFARSGDVPLDMGALMKSVCGKCGGKGGGKPDFAQGGGPRELMDAAKLSLISSERPL